MNTLGCRLYDRGARFQRGDTYTKTPTRWRQHQDKCSPETEYINAPSPITSPFLTIFLKMNFLRPRCPLKTGLLFSFTYLHMCRQLHVPWQLCGDQRTNGKSQLSPSPQVPSIELSHLVSAISWAQDASFTEFLPPNTLTAL